MGESYDSLLKKAMINVSFSRIILNKKPCQSFLTLTGLVLKSKIDYLILKAFSPGK